MSVADEVAKYLARRRTLVARIERLETTVRYCHGHGPEPEPTGGQLRLPGLTLRALGEAHSVLLGHLAQMDGR